MDALVRKGSYQILDNIERLSTNCADNGLQCSTAFCIMPAAVDLSTPGALCLVWPKGLVKVWSVCPNERYTLLTVLRTGTWVWWTGPWTRTWGVEQHSTNQAKRPDQKLKDPTQYDQRHIDRRLLPIPVWLGISSRHRAQGTIALRIPHGAAELQTKCCLVRCAQCGLPDFLAGNHT